LAFLFNHAEVDKKGTMHHVGSIVKKSKGISIDHCCNKTIGKIERQRNKELIGRKIIFSRFHIFHKEIDTERKEDAKKKGKCSMKKDNKPMRCSTKQIHQGKKERCNKIEKFKYG
jgi:hypothetical protein